MYSASLIIFFVSPFQYSKIIIYHAHHSHRFELDLEKNGGGAAVAALGKSNSFFDMVNLCARCRGDSIVASRLVCITDRRAAGLPSQDTSDSFQGKRAADKLCQCCCLLTKRWIESEREGLSWKSLLNLYYHFQNMELNYRLLRSAINWWITERKNRMADG